MQSFFPLLLAIVAIIVLAIVGRILYRRRSSTEDSDVLAHTIDDPKADIAADTVATIIVPEQPPEQIPEPAPERELISFDIAYEPVKRIEGGYQKHPADRGNYNSLGQLVGTNWGIAAPVAERYFNRVPTEEMMRKLSAKVAADIYRTEFWDKMKGNFFPTQALANIVFDGMVNHGSWGIKLLQRALGIREDGVVGPVTLRAIKARDPEKLIQAYYTMRYNFYHAIVRNRPSQKVFLKGWLRRLAHYKP